MFFFLFNHNTLLFIGTDWITKFFLVGRQNSIIIIIIIIIFIIIIIIHHVLRNGTVDDKKFHFRT